MVRDELSVLSAFLAVAEERSFTRAAKRLGVSTSALSHAMRGLEERFGVHLLARTTRSVAPTDAGEQLIARLRPALGDIQGALDLISGLRDRPAGRVRLIVSPIAATTVLAPKLGQFARDYPDVVLDVTTDESRVDLVAGRFDAGIHFGEFIERDMITFRVSKDHRPAIVGSPRYFESHEKPVHPRDLTSHRCINFRHGSAGVYRWECDKGKQSPTVAVNGPLIVDDVEIMVRAFFFFKQKTAYEVGLGIPAEPLFRSMRQAVYCCRHCLLCSSRQHSNGLSHHGRRRSEERRVGKECRSRWAT